MKGLSKLGRGSIAMCGALIIVLDPFGLRGTKT